MQNWSMLQINEIMLQLKSCHIIYMPDYKLPCETLQSHKPMQVNIKWSNIIHLFPYLPQVGQLTKVKWADQDPAIYCKVHD